MVTTPVPPTPSMIDDQPSLSSENCVGLRHAVERLGLSGDAFGLADLGAVHRDEGRAKAVDAGEILVAARLVDFSLAAELGLDRLDRDAVRLHAAVAAAFADEFVDDDALVGVRERAALAAAALFGGAGLVVEQHRDALDVAQLALDEVEVVAVMERRAGRELRAVAIFAGLVGDHRDALDAFGPDLARDHVDGEVAFMRLAAGHGDGVVVEDLVGDVGVGRERETHRQNAGMIVGAVAEILEDVVALGERRLADPLRPLAAHLGEADGRAVHPQGHEMTAYSGAGDRAFRHLGRGIVRTARTEERRARADVLGVGEHGLILLQPGDPRGYLVRRADDLQDALAERDRDVVGIERALCRKQPVAALVLLADDGRLHGRAVQVFADLHLDQRALLLDHDDHFEAAGEILDVLDVERPRAADLEQPHADRLAAASSMPMSSSAWRTSR